MPRKVSVAFSIWTPNRTRSVWDALNAAATTEEVVLHPPAGGVIECGSIPGVRSVATQLLESMKNELGQSMEVWLGLGRVISASRNKPTSESEAKRAIFAARRLGQDPGVVSLDQLLLVDVLLNSASLSHLADLLSGLKGGSPRRSAKLYESLEAYMDNDLSLSAASKQLGIHPHTLAYRLRRIEELLGLSLGRSQERQVIEAAVLAGRLASRRFN